MASPPAKVRRHLVALYRVVRLRKKWSRGSRSATHAMLDRLARVAGESVAFILLFLIAASVASAQQSAPAPAQSSAGGASAPAIARPAVGKLRVLVVPAFWSDYAGAEPASVARIAELMSMVRAYYLEASYG